ncbi:MAG: cytochrome c-type biogenesis protein CcmH [Alphaproteobacteria bacterium]|nr:cytochrome c-type biogenesis protein CcmH [Alphaproteobacteria bacterium]
MRQGFFPLSRFGVCLAMLLCFASMTLHVSPLWAVEPGEILADPKLEARARELSSQLRCLVCQNQSIDDSQAPLAKDLRVIVRERLVAGDDDAAIMAYLVQRYGDFVLLKPPFKFETMLLWLTPFALLVLGAFGLWRLSARRAPLAVPDLETLSEAEEAQLAAMLDPEKGQLGQKDG